MDVHTEAGCSGDYRRDEHVARSARVLTDDYAAASPGQAMRSGATQRIGEGRLQVDIGYATDSIRAE
jgi:hypothetical protein